MSPAVPVRYNNPPGVRRTLAGNAPPDERTGSHLNI
jgi:hypothetical protein